MKSLFPVIKMFLLLFFLWFMIHTAYILWDGWNDEEKESHIGVVLGNKVMEDGSPSERLQARLDKAVEFHQRGLLDQVIVSGGVGVEGYDEAKVMKEYLVDHAIPAEVILVDQNGYNTMQTAQNARSFLKYLEMSLETTKVTVITQHFHITRSKLAFKEAGFEQVYGAHADFLEWRDVYSTIREFPAYYKYLWFSS
ncbi:YdcF family protein [Gracilibacillus sp. YIM 98692]|uniref:YdcF family protein n=1 Tax=Gracilibacillus sp. YIM 98692 TaxID=2663532 RepID=UPI0013D5871B|nr:YdcF family protein [Gracilibacillus sp. YIM 98692]